MTETNFIPSLCCVAIVKRVTLGAAGDLLMGFRRVVGFWKSFALGLSQLQD